MNKYTWKQCINLAVDELADSGIHYIKNEKIAHNIHSRLTINENLNIPYNHSKHEPTLFLLFLECKAKIVKYCSEQIKIGKLLTEVLRAEIRTTILPQSYDDYVKDLMCNGIQHITT